MTETCRACGADLRDELDWCPRCLAPREEPEPVYGQSTLPPAPGGARMRRWEWSVRGFGPAARVAVAVVLIVLWLWVFLFVNFLLALPLLILSAVILWDVTRRHRDWR